MKIKMTTILSMIPLILSAIVLLVLLSLGGCATQDSTYNVEITTKDGGVYYVEVVTEAYIDDLRLPTQGVRNLSLDAGTHTITWSYANINGFGMHLNERTKMENVVIDCDKSITISGGSIYFTEN